MRHVGVHRLPDLSDKNTMGDKGPKNLVLGLKVRLGSVDFPLLIVA